MDNPVAAEILSDNGQTTVILREDLDLYAVPVVKPIILDAVVGNPEGGFVIDLSRVSFVDSAGLAFLLTLRKNPSLDGRLSVHVGIKSHPERVLQLTHLDAYINVVSVPTSE